MHWLSHPGNNLFYLVLLLLNITACSSATDIDVDQVIQEKVEERLATFKSVLDKNCMERIYDDAGEIADSIILEYARQKRDTTQRPLRPFRPDEPALKVLEDTLLLQPLFDTIPPSDTLQF